MCGNYIAEPALVPALQSRVASATLKRMSLLTLISIPIIGALVGYVTNWVAIRMLFRPHKEKRIFGLRIPFTPGLIPRKRLELAKTIGRAVGQELLTGEALASRIEDREFREKIQIIIRDYTQELLSKELPSLNALVPSKFRADWDAFIADLKRKLGDWSYQLLTGSEMQTLIRAQVKQRVEELLKRPLQEVVPASILKELPTQLGHFFENSTRHADFTSRIHGFISQRIDAALSEDKRLGDYIPEQLKTQAYSKLEDLMPELLEKFISILSDEQIKKRIKIQLYELVDSLIAQAFKEDSMWDQIKFGLIETFVISAEELKLKIDRGVDEAAPTIAQLVREPAVCQRIYKALKDAIDAFLARRLSEFQPTELGEFKAQLGDAVVNIFRSEALKGQLVKLTAERLEAYKAQSIREIFSLGLDRVDAIADRVVEQVLAMLKEESTAEALGSLMNKKLDELLNRPIGRLSDYLPARFVAQGQEWMSEQLLTLLRREAPKILEAVNIEKLVAERVDAFSIAEVERLIVRVTGDQLRAITWFGAVLGFVIGLIQVAVMLVTRAGG